MFQNSRSLHPRLQRSRTTRAPEAISVGSMLDAMRDDVPPELQLLVRAMVQILVIELLAYHTFAWASDVLGDPVLQPRRRLRPSNHRPHPHRRGPSRRLPPVCPR
ncbi:MAG: hypothetical protein M5T61_16860 [Acidimicrobiia bacterium]|nr:hypothetical protein [Acidimicrobiia bacterium]